MTARYKDKVVIVTGGSKGIGEGCVRVFVRNGSKVVFCARNEEEGHRLENELNSNPENSGTAVFRRCDVRNEEEIKSLVKFTLDRFGQLDCLINNAGWHPPHAPIDDFTSQDFRSLLELNLVSYFVACKYALPHLRASRGNVINMSSLVATMGQVGAVSYVTTKGGILGLTNALSVDEAKYNVRVNAVSPGNVWTPLWDENAKQTDDAQKAKKDGEDAQLIGRMGTIEEAGEACLFLAAEATFCTGVNLPLTGGAELSYGFKNRIEQSRI